MQQNCLTNMIYTCLRDLFWSPGPELPEAFTTKEEHIIKFPKFNYDLSEGYNINIKYSTIDGLLDGYYLLYDRFGKLLSKKHYCKGELDGETIDYNIFVKKIDGLKKIKKYVCLYSNGKQIGCKEYE